MQNEKETGSIPEHFGLSLSGGGFRATLFHLGMIRLLQETGLLHRLRFVSGVSGGAILAAHLGLNWTRYIGDTASFDAAAQEIVEFTQRDVRNRILRRWIVGWLTIVPRLFLGWSRVELLRREYQTLYGEKRLAEFPNVYQEQGPRTILQCASMTTGLPSSFGRSGLMLYKEKAEGRGIGLEPDQELTTTTTLSVAHGVTASSAFPPMFPPLRIDHKLLRCSQLEFPVAHDLTDGGVFDNMGMDRPLRWFMLPGHPHPADQLRTFLISDAEGAFNQTIGSSWRYKFTLTRNVRATEILMRRATTLNWKYLSGLNLDLIRVPEPAAETSIDGLESALAIRTDLDRFSNVEVEALLLAGFRAAREALEKCRWIETDIPDTPWRPVAAPKVSDEERKKLLEKARYRRWMPLFLPRT